MPYVGQASFLHLSLKITMVAVCISVNALCRASLISTKPVYMEQAITVTVSMPYVGQASFLQYRNKAIPAEDVVCQCPMSGKPHFYRPTGRNCSQKSDLCQCPMSGKPHFYSIGRAADLYSARCVSMPYVGQASFLPLGTLMEDANDNLCQCPMSGKPHFYVRITEKEVDAVNVCQCPMSGKPHFYRWAGSIGTNNNYCVNALCRASLISTQSIILNIWITLFCVNALCRASLISTLL